MGVSMRNRLLAGALALLAVVLGGTVGYWVIGDGAWPLRDCLYMTVITVTTVGYGEILPDMAHVPYARGFTIGLLVFGTGILVYFASMITAFVVEGDLNNMLRAQRLRKRMQKMKDHVIVCGAGNTGIHIIEELIATRTPVVVIDLRSELLMALEVKHVNQKFSYIVGDATDDAILAQAQVTSARGVVAALSSDKDNLYLVVSTRQENPNARIVARCADVAHIDKLRRAGADSVVSPNQIGGMRMVSELIRPAIVRFLDEMLRDKRAAYRIEEVNVGPASALCGTPLAEAQIRERFGMSVLALRSGPGAPWSYNPDGTTAIGSGTTLVVLGSPAQVVALRAVADAALTAS